MRTAIIGAMEEEIRHFLSLGESFEEHQKAHLTLYTGTLHGTDVVITRCGVGKVNAAVTTQILIDVFNAERIIFTGVAGALEPSLEIGDLVVSEACRQHDLDASPLGFAKGEVPMFDGPSLFRADENLVRIAAETAEQVSGVQVMRGIILSGDQFVADRDRVAELRSEFDGVCVEMEGAAVAHAAMVNKVPFVILRSISDKANGQAPENFNGFVEKTAARSAQIVEHMLNRLS
ncbi:5'-methylthioadenosine/adenosylhomocysteine nucleosidase [Alteribacter natronophilus]|uniref:5'-methylthioadenosine/adenosylhomocysteine nucleosidase n=1 Tax=Alteribacter natronophilus TaxID=2583810 RepID=UPI00110F196E|nr:5'-methylthioadenosine/adenosylhomocysteine nucleosidase [Alteribacter natronophilus]TMW71747.1 5'-methylthioadenosine/adenosylhomocysteine nucleosidase [Alteribacter natronophilus]